MDTEFLESLLNDTDYRDVAQACEAEWVLRRRTAVVRAALDYLRERRALLQELGELPALVELPPKIARYLSEV